VHERAGGCVFEPETRDARETEASARGLRPIDAMDRSRKITMLLESVAHDELRRRLLEQSPDRVASFVRRVPR
jgi:hypothetical protein